ncbi:hypothetical protein BC828DRAFT_390489 [Blastocladiella britannica]|nr:hypothetical protein BC828DRAFT_390489 [Blastocladiella britannica]
MPEATLLKSPSVKSSTHSRSSSYASVASASGRPNFRSARVGAPESAAGGSTISTLAGVRADTIAPVTSTLLRSAIGFSAVRWAEGHLALVSHALVASPSSKARLNGPPLLLGMAPLAAHVAGSNAALYLGPDFALSPVTSTNPFDSPVLVSATVRDSALVHVFRVPASGISEAEAMTTPVSVLAGHELPVMQTVFHPLVPGVLATASRDDTLQLWDIEAMCSSSSRTAAGAQYVQFDPRGDCLAWIRSSATSSTVFICDPRSATSSDRSFQLGNVRPGARFSWLDEKNMAVMAGQRAETCLQWWDLRSLSSPVTSCPVPGARSSSLPILHADTMLQVLYTSQRGASDIKVVHARSGTFDFVSEIKLGSQNIAMEQLPKLTLDPRRAEIARLCRLTDAHTLEIAPVTLLRKDAATRLQSDLYPPIDMPSGKVDAAAYFGSEGKSVVSDMLAFRELDAVPDPMSPLSAPAAKGRQFEVIAGTLQQQQQSQSQSQSQELAAIQEDTKEPDGGESGLKSCMAHLVQSTGSFSAPKFRVVELRLLTGVRFLVVDPSSSGRVLGAWSPLRDFVDVSCPQPSSFALRTRYHGTWLFQLSSAELAEAWRSNLAAELAIRAAPRPPTRIAGRLKAHMPKGLVSGRVQGAAEPQPVYLALEESGTLMIYPDEAAFITLDSRRPPYCLNHISDVLSVRIVQQNDGSSPSGTMLAILYLSFSLVLVAETSEAAANWFVALHQVMAVAHGGKSGGAPHALSSQCLYEGPITVTAGLPQLKVRNCWLVAMQTHLFYFESRVATAPLARVDHLASFTAAPEKLELVLVSERGSATHVANDLQQCERWESAFDRIIRSSGSFLRQLGITAESWPTVDTKAFESLLLTLDAGVRQRAPLLAIVRERTGPVFVVEPTWKSLDDATSCVLDMGARIYQWNGTASPLAVRARAMDLANKIRTKERKNRSTIIQISQHQPADAARECLTHLGYSLPTAAASDPFPAFSGPSHAGEHIVYRIWLEGDVPRSEIVFQGRKQLTCKILDGGGCYLVLVESHELWLWTSARSPVRDRQLATAVASLLMKQRPSPLAARIMQDMEPMVFAHKFSDMDQTIPIALRAAKSSSPSNAIAATTSLATTVIAVDPVLALAAAEVERLRQAVVPKFGPDDAVHVHSVGNFTTQLMHRSRLSQLDRSQAYIVLWIQKRGATQRCTGHFYQGAKATQLDKGSAALLTVSLCEQAQVVSGEVSQVRVEEGLEPVSLWAVMEPDSCFLLLDGPVKENTVLDIRDRHPGVLVGVQCEIEPAHFGAYHFSILVGRTGAAHRGPHAPPALSEAAAARISTVFPTWKSLVPSALTTPVEASPLALPQLFVVSNCSGSLAAEPACPFVQSSLAPNGIAVLDTTRAIYCWVGSQVDTVEVVAALKFALALAEKLSGRKAPLVVYPGQEPIEFIACFHGWVGRPFAPDSKMLMLQDAKFLLSEYTRSQYSLKELQAIDLAKSCLDLTRLEDYLSDADFASVFEMGRSKFAALPKWKQEEAKKRARLY